MKTRKKCEKEKERQRVRDRNVTLVLLSSDNQNIGEYNTVHFST